MQKIQTRHALKLQWHCGLCNRKGQSLARTQTHLLTHALSLIVTLSNTFSLTHTLSLTPPLTHLQRVDVDGRKEKETIRRRKLLFSSITRIVSYSWGMSAKVTILYLHT